MSWDKESFKSKLEAEHQFPGIYLFKFVVPIQKKEEVMAILPKGEISQRNSSKNTYTSISLKARMDSSEQVIDVYMKAYQIEGIVAL